MTTLFDRIWEGHVVARAPEEGSRRSSTSIFTSFTR